MTRIRSFLATLIVVVGGCSSPSVLEATTLTVYDGLGRPRIRLDANGEASMVFLDAQGRRLMEFTSDVRVSPTSLRVGPGGDSTSAPGLLLFGPDGQIQAEVAVVGSVARVRLASSEGERVAEFSSLRDPASEGGKGSAR